MSLYGEEFKVDERVTQDDVTAISTMNQCMPNERTLFCLLLDKNQQKSETFFSIRIQVRRIYQARLFFYL